MVKPCTVTFKEGSAENPSLRPTPYKLLRLFQTQCHRMSGLRVRPTETPEFKKGQQTHQSSRIEQRGERQLGTRIFYLPAQYLFCIPSWLSREILAAFSLPSPPAGPQIPAHNLPLGWKGTSPSCFPPTPFLPFLAGHVSIRMPQEIIDTTLAGLSREGFNTGIGAYNILEGLKERLQAQLPGMSLRRHH